MGEVRSPASLAAEEFASPQTPIHHQLGRLRRREGAFVPPGRRVACFWRTLFSLQSKPDGRTRNLMRDGAGLGLFGPSKPDHSGVAAEMTK